MKDNRQAISYVLNSYKSFFQYDDEIQEILVDKIYNVYQNSKTFIKMPDKLISLFNDVGIYTLTKKVAKKIVYDISCETRLTEIIDELQSYDTIKDKLSIDRENYTILLKIHDNFIVKTELATQKTFINDKFYYDIEEQDILECYCDFVTDSGIYVLYKKRRLLSFIGLAHPYLKILSDEKKVPKLINNKSVYMIFTNKELIYKSP